MTTWANVLPRCLATYVASFLDYYCPAQKDHHVLQVADISMGDMPVKVHILTLIRGKSSRAASFYWFYLVFELTVLEREVLVVCCVMSTYLQQTNMRGDFHT